MRFFKIGLVALATSFLFGSLVYANTEYDTTTVYVTAQSGLNIRQTPNTNLDRIDVVPYGSELQLIGQTDTQDWSYILYKNQIKYICNLYISKEKPQQKQNNIINALYTPANFKQAGVIHWGGYRWTWYSERILPGYGLKIPGRYTDNLGYVRDENGYLCLASSDLNKGTIVDTPFGSKGKVYDCGCAHGTLDVYVGW